MADNVSKVRNPKNHDDEVKQQFSFQSLWMTHSSLDFHTMVLLVDQYFLGHFYFNHFSFGSLVYWGAMTWWDCSSWGLKKSIVARLSKSKISTSILFLFV